MSRWTLTLDISVHDAHALRRAAETYLLASDQSLAPEDTLDLLGFPDEPNIGACLAMLLDRSELLDGAEIEQHSVECDEDDKDEDQ
jgi:hypothetical protein